MSLRLNESFSYDFCHWAFGHDEEEYNTLFIDLHVLSRWNILHEEHSFAPTDGMHDSITKMLSLYNESHLPSAVKSFNTALNAVLEAFKHIPSQSEGDTRKLHMIEANGVFMLIAYGSFEDAKACHLMAHEYFKSQDKS
jgi:hypothetical protein